MDDVLVQKRLGALLKGREKVAEVKADLIVVVTGSGAGDVGPVGGEGGSAGGQHDDATDAESQGAGPARRPAASPTLIPQKSSLHWCLGSVYRNN